MTSAEIADAAAGIAERMCIAAGFRPDGGGDYTSRGTGNGTGCEVDSSILATARAIVKELASIGVWAEIHTCDEWVTISLAKGVRGGAR